MGFSRAVPPLQSRLQRLSYHVNAQSDWQIYSQTRASLRSSSFNHEEYLT